MGVAPMEAYMIVDAIADLHGYYPELEGGDLLIVAGDLTKRDTKEEYFDFFTWIAIQKYKKKILIAGNHDNFTVEMPEVFNAISDFDYLCDSGTEFEGLKIWGSPHSLWFPQVNPKCAAFMDSEYNLAAIYEKIPNNIDILISHGPPIGILDQNVEGSSCGSQALLNAIERIKPRLVIFGHIHEQGGKIVRKNL